PRATPSSRRPRPIWRRWSATTRSTIAASAPAQAGSGRWRGWTPSALPASRSRRQGRLCDQGPRPAVTCALGRVTRPTARATYATYATHATHAACLRSLLTLAAQQAPAIEQDRGDEAGSRGQHAVVDKLIDGVERGNARTARAGEDDPPTGREQIDQDAQ